MEKKPRLPAIEYIRGISMMGVIGIHVGSQYIMNPMSNLHLTALFEVATRFSVPIFFFISAFGMFYHLDPEKPFDYRSFMKRRLRTVLIPYLAWSFFYIVHDAFLYGTGLPSIPSVAALLFFGNAKYQLYFLVILLWFYLLMPLWIAIVERVSIRGMLGLFFLQVGFDYWSSFDVAFNLYVYGLPSDSLLRPFLFYRLNYWVLHYFFIFLLGGWLALRMDGFFEFMARRRKLINLCFFLSFSALMGYYYELILIAGYTQMEAVNTAHQLCPLGIIYTVAASLFFFSLFTSQGYPKWLDPVLSLLGRHSYFAYLAHPIAIAYLGMAAEASGRIMTAPLAMGLYFAVLILSIGAALISRKAGEKFPMWNLMTVGVRK